MRIICRKNKGYKWVEKCGIHFKGYLQDDTGRVFKSNEAISLLNEIETYADFKVFLQSVFGVYSIIIEKNAETWLAVDIARSMPLYYDDECHFISDSAEEIRICKHIEKNNVDSTRVLEFYATSYIVGNNTIFEEIKQLDLGSSAIICNGKIECEYYFVHKSATVELDRENALSQVKETTNRAMTRLKNVVGDRQIVLSLSGGYDSRYLACSLKENGFENVLCYTYGGKNSFEPIQSKKVADALGFKWVNVEYNDDKIKELVSPLMDDYFLYTQNYDYISYIQNYIAFKELVSNKLIDSDAIIMTGLCNDMPTGYYTPIQEDVLSNYELSRRGCAEYLYDQRFVKFSISETMKSKLISEIEENLADWELDTSDFESFVHASDCANTAYSHSRCFVHMNDVHDFFSHEWLLFCWDKELLQMWYSLPASMRLHQNLYEEYIVEVLGKKYGVGTKKEIRTVGKSLKSQKLIRTLGSKLIKPLYFFGVPVRRTTDINNFASLEVQLYKKIKQKRAIKSKYAAITLLLTVFLMEKRHGVNWYKYISQYIRG